jgi:hypothetical protein
VYLQVQARSFVAMVVLQLVQLVLAIRLQITGEEEDSNDAKEQATPSLLLLHTEVQQAQQKQQHPKHQQGDVEQGGQQVKQGQEQSSNGSSKARLQRAAAGVQHHGTHAALTLRPAPDSASIPSKSVGHKLSRACPPCISVPVAALWSNTFEILLPLVPFILAYDIFKHVGLMTKDLVTSVVKEGPWKALKQSLGNKMVQVGSKLWAASDGVAAYSHFVLRLTGTPVQRHLLQHLEIPCLVLKLCKSGVEQPAMWATAQTVSTASTLVSMHCSSAHWQASALHHHCMATQGCTLINTRGSTRCVQHALQTLPSADVMTWCTAPAPA